MARFSRPSSTSWIRDPTSGGRSTGGRTKSWSAAAAWCSGWRTRLRGSIPTRLRHPFSKRCCGSPAALLAEYQAAGLDYGPPGGPLETLDELGRVLGMTPATLGAIRPHLTLFGPAEPNPATTDPVVAVALAQSAQGSPIAPPANQLPQDLSTTRITAAASGPGNARVIRFAVAQIGSALPQGYTVLTWGSRTESAPQGAAPEGAVTR